MRDYAISRRADASQNEPWETEGRRRVCRPRGLLGGGVPGALCAGLSAGPGLSAWLVSADGGAGP